MIECQSSSIQIATWLDPALINVNAISDLLMPYDPGLMRCYPVGTRLNHVEHDDEECCRPVQPAQVQEGLFQ